MVELARRALDALGLRFGAAHVEVWAEPPSSEPWLERESGVWVDDAAPYEFD